MINSILNTKNVTIKLSVIQTMEQGTSQDLKFDPLLKGTGLVAKNPKSSTIWND